MIPEQSGHPSERSDAGVKYFSDFYEFVKLDFFFRIESPFKLMR